MKREIIFDNFFMTFNFFINVIQWVNVTFHTCLVGEESSGQTHVWIG